jgi:hypothetical protein
VAAPIARSLHPASRKYSATIRALLRVIGLFFGDRLYQRSIRSEEFVPIVAVGVVEQFAQCLRRKGLRLVHAARNVILHG